MNGSAAAPRQTVHAAARARAFTDSFLRFRGSVGVDMRRPAHSYQEQRGAKHKDWMKDAASPKHLEFSLPGSMYFDATVLPVEW